MNTTKKLIVSSLLMSLVSCNSGSDQEVQDQQSVEQNFHNTMFSLVSKYVMPNNDLYYVSDGVLADSMILSALRRINRAQTIDVSYIAQCNHYYAHFGFEGHFTFKNDNQRMQHSISPSENETITQIYVEHFEKLDRTLERPLRHEAYDPIEIDLNIINENDKDFQATLELDLYEKDRHAMLLKQLKTASFLQLPFVLTMCPKNILEKQLVIATNRFLGYDARYMVSGTIQAVTVIDREFQEDLAVKAGLALSDDGKLMKTVR